jgi:hypothetical protein
MNRRLAHQGGVRRGLRGSAASGGGGGGGGGGVDALPWFARWRADTGVTLATGVSVWTDSIGGLTLVPVGAANSQPSVQASVAELGGRTALRFDGVNDGLISSLSAASWNGLHDGLGTYEVWIVGVPRVAANRVIASTRLSTAATSRGWSIDTTTVGAVARLHVVNGTASVVSATGGTLASGTGTYIGAYYDEGRAGNEYSLLVRGSAAVTGNSTNAPDTGDAAGTLALACFANGTGFNQIDVSEVAMFGPVLSDDERATWVAHVQSYYSL